MNRRDFIKVAVAGFDPGKLPDIGKALGKSMREFKQAVNEADSKQVTTKAEAKIVIIKFILGR